MLDLAAEVDLAALEALDIGLETILDDRGREVLRTAREEIGDDGLAADEATEEGAAFDAEEGTAVALETPSWIGKHHKSNNQFEILLESFDDY